MTNAQKQPPPQQPRVIMDPQNYQRPVTQRPRPVQDIRQTKEYKAAARRWISTIVALPILMYTSYMLFERTYGNKSPRAVAPASASASPSASLSGSASSGEESTMANKKDGN